MVIYSGRCVAMLLSVFLVWACCSAVGEGEQAAQAKKPDNERLERITKQLTTHIKSVDRTTPFRVVETLAKSLGDGNLANYIDCFTDEGKKAMTGGRDLPPDQIEQMSARMQAAGFQRSIIHSISVDLDPDPAQIEIVLSSVRGQVRIRERFKASLIETEQGWKLDQPSTEILTREQIDSTGTNK